MGWGRNGTGNGGDEIPQQGRCRAWKMQTGKVQSRSASTTSTTSNDRWIDRSLEGPPLRWPCLLRSNVLLPRGEAGRAAQNVPSVLSRGKARGTRGRGCGVYWQSRGEQSAAEVSSRRPAHLPPIVLLSHSRHCPIAQIPPLYPLLQDVAAFCADRFLPENMEKRATVFSLRHAPS